MRAATIFVAIGLFLSAALAAAGEWEEWFVDPPQRSRPETWFDLCGGNLSKDGLTCDLEAIAGAGIQGLQMLHVHGAWNKVWPGTKGQIRCMSPEWYDFIGYFGRECKRLGLSFKMHTCPGWSMAGGPWIPADRTMRNLVYAQTICRGGACVGVLPRPAEADDHSWRDYRDLVVIAFPSPVGDAVHPLHPSRIKGSPTYDASTVRSYYIDPIVKLPPDDAVTSAKNWQSAVLTDDDRRFAFPDEDGIAEVELGFDVPVTVRTLELSPVQRMNHFWCFDPGVTVRVLAARGTDWHEVSRRVMPPSSWQDDIRISLAIPPTTATDFRIRFEHRHGLVLSSVKLYSGARGDNWESEAGRDLRGLMDDGPADAQGEAIDPQTIRDVTAFFRANGTIDWTPPKGSWTVLRVGHVNAGIQNHPAPPEATGWECDKLSKEGADVHYAGFIGKLTAPGGPLAGGLLNGIMMDSWEAEAQTWTPGLDRMFAAHWGYGLERHWPSLVGYVVGSRRDNSLFLRDWRELLGDLVFKNFYSRMAENAHRNGQVSTWQTCGCDVLAADPMKHWRDVDEPMCEFWRIRTKFGGVGSLDYKSVRPCVSAARVYGKRRVSAEALTRCGLDWRIEYPRAFKVDLDYYFALGVTHPVFSNFAHNPQVGFLPPGAPYSDGGGSVFGRGQTWWRYAKDFTDYIARSTHLLESGRNVSDILLYLGDRVGHKPPQHLSFPAGFSYDYLNKDAFLTRITVKDGLWTTPEGLSWKALWLYDPKDLRPETVAKLSADEKAGGKVIRGDIFAGVLSLGLEPQIVAPANLVWQHRTTGNEEIYYFAEEHGEPFDGAVRLRGEGMALLADPVSGKVKPVYDVTCAEGYANVRLEMPRFGGRFIVIRKGAASATSSQRNETKSEYPLLGTWTLTFAKGWGRDEPVKTDKLVSWSELPGTEEQKSYSGTVSYALTFDGPEAVTRGDELTLSLGEVETAAEVWINGKKIGLAWTWPYVFDVTGKVKPGRNDLRIEVTGSWHNRLRYDIQQPEKERKTWTLGWPDPKNSPLQPSGLLGPVSITCRSSGNSR